VGKENIAPNHQTLEIPPRLVKIVNVTEAQLAQWLKDHDPGTANVTVVPLMLTEDWMTIWT
jgi:hypothetical protein